MKHVNVRRLAATAVLAASTWAMSAGDGIAQGIACGEELYTVRPGDSLSEIAQRAYSSFNYGVIFDANQDVMMNPALLLPGQELFIPCLDGSGPATKAAALGRPAEPEVAVETVEEPEALSDPVVRRTVVVEDAAGGDALAALTAEEEAAAAGRTIRFLTGSDYAPFTHRDLPEGGMLTEVVNRAMLRADPGRSYDITWENDWGQHLSELLPSGAHDLGFPWYRPDCSVAEKLSEAMRARCTDFHFSRPLYEVTVGYYLPTAVAEVRAEDHGVLLGKTICRPAGYFTFDLEEVGLVEPQVRMVTPDSPGDCFEMLAGGEVDVVTMNAFLAEREIAELGLDGKVEAAPGLASTETLHVVAAKSNPYGQAYLALIDRGLRQLREEGVWADITQRHLVEHAKSL